MQTTEPSLDHLQVEQFIHDGYVKLADAFSRDVASEARAILWRDTRCDPDDRSTWTRPVIRLGDYRDPPFIQSANTPRLHGAFDQLVGSGRWLARGSMGTFPVRFPSREIPRDTGWHIDPSFDYEKADFMGWRTNIFSKGRALLMLFLFSDVEEEDAPTRIRAGSHLDIARRLAPAGEAGMTLGELAVNNFDETAYCEEVHATGEAGTVYLCHPFLVHAAQAHRGTRPRFMAQPPLLPAVPIRLDREEGDYSAVEFAIRSALHS
jgi:Phytanoyl-CoA dioxygenase (PhyH)